MVLLSFGVFYQIKMVCKTPTEPFLQVSLLHEQSTSGTATPAGEVSRGSLPSAAGQNESPDAAVGTYPTGDPERRGWNRQGGSLDDGRLQSPTVAI